MATDFTQDSLLYFIQSNGGRVKNSELLFHYKAFVRDNENKTHYRELFKKFVNCVAVVKQEEGVSYVVLRKKFGGQARDVSAPCPSSTPGLKPEHAPREKQRAPRAAETRNQEGACRYLTESHLLVEVPCDTNQNTILPSAGILSNNNNNEEKVISLEKPIQSSSYVPERELPQILNVHEPLPYDTTSKGSNVETVEAAWPNEPATLPELNPKGIYTGGTHGQPKETNSHQRDTPFHPPPDSQPIQVLGVEEDSVEPLGFEQEESVDVEPCGFEQAELRVLTGRGQRPSLRAEDDGRRSVSPATVLPLQTRLERTDRISTSSPSISVSHAPTPPPDPEPACSNAAVPHLGSPSQGGPGSHIQCPEESTAATLRSRHSLPLEPDFYSPSGSPDLPPPYRQVGAGLSSSHSCLLLSSADSHEWPQGSPEDEWTSEEELDHRRLTSEQGVKVHEMLRRAQEAKMLSLLHRAERKVAPYHRSVGHLPDDQDPSPPPSSSSWHRSTGHLDDQEPKSPWHRSAGHLGEDCESSADSDPGSSAGGAGARPRPPVRRLHSKLRSRMCRSLGADLDRPFPEDGVLAARRSRLQLLSSTLSIRYPSSAGSTPSHSLGDLTSPTGSAGSHVSPPHGAYSPRQDPAVPLEPAEHDWLVKGASGAWTDVYALFREEPSLLNKHDFISGYTVLHWIAKHGDHRVLNTLWYGVSKAGLRLDVDARTTCGYTPLHLAAIHGHKKMIRLLVYKFHANVALRDTSGKKPWQYLGRSGPKELLEMLGGETQRAAGGGARGGASAAPPRSLPQRPGTARVKRSTSIAAFLKHHTLRRLPGHQSDSSV